MLRLRMFATALMSNGTVTNFNLYHSCYYQLYVTALVCYSAQIFYSDYQREQFH